MAIWTPDALRSELRPASGAAWRLVEAQHRISTLKLVDGLAEYAALESILEDSKPAVPVDCRGLDYLLYSPFRHGQYPNGSRFRRAGVTPGVFYCSTNIGTAVAETAFYRLLFFADSPATPWPRNALEFTAIQIRYATQHLLDLGGPPLNVDAPLWTDPGDHGPTQQLADDARQAGAQVLRYTSVRDPGHRANIALLTGAAFARKVPVARSHWQLFLSASGVVALADRPAATLFFGHRAFDPDSRISAMRWHR